MLAAVRMMFGHIVLSKVGLGPARKSFVQLTPHLVTVLHAGQLCVLPSIASFCAANLFLLQVRTGSALERDNVCGLWVEYQTCMRGSRGKFSTEVMCNGV